MRRAADALAIGDAGEIDVDGVSPPERNRLVQAGQLVQDSLATLGQDRS